MKKVMLFLILQFLCITAVCHAVKVVDLNSIGVPANEDELYIIDDPSGTPANRKVSVSNLRTGILTGDITVTGTVTADGFLVNSGSTDSILATTGTLVLGGTNGAYNEDLTFNFDKNTDEVYLGSTTGVDEFHLDGMGIFSGGENDIDIIAKYQTNIGGYFNGGGVDIISGAAKTNLKTVLRLTGSSVYDQSIITATSESGNQIIFGGGSISQDYDHASATNFTMYIHSASFPNNTNNQWGAFTHDQEDFVISSGANVGTGASPTTDENAIEFHPRGTLAVEIDGDGGLIPKKVTSDPCGVMKEGSIFYNDTSNYMCYCNGTDDVKMSDDTTACF